MFEFFESTPVVALALALVAEEDAPRIIAFFAAQTAEAFSFEQGGAQDRSLS
jgi:hypothetical protein